MMLRLTLITTLACILLLQAQGNDDTPTEHSSGQLRGPVVTEVTAADEDQEILIVSFDSDSTEHPWTTINDPVMGGASTSTITVSSGLGVWEGEVRVVDSLGAPGFCTLRTGNLGDEQHFPDPTGTDYLTVRMEGASGLPVESFSAEISVSGVTDREHMYQAHLSDEYCCEMSCQVPWSVFQLSWRGKSWLSRITCCHYYPYVGTSHCRVPTFTFVGALIYKLIQRCARISVPAAAFLFNSAPQIITLFCF